MAHKALGKHYRKGITLVELFKMFPDNASAEKWFVETRWPDGIRCAYCDSQNVKDNASHKTIEVISSKKCITNLGSGYILTDRHCKL